MNTKAISPVIATVIIVSVAIAIAVAVAFWMTGITGLFTRYEKLEVVNAYAIANESTGHFYIILTVKNTGSSDATIDEIFINGKPLSVVGAVVTTNETAATNPGNVTDWISTISQSLASGDELKLVIDLGTIGSTFKHGQIVEVKIHTVAGNEYPRSVQLP